MKFWNNIPLGGKYTVKLWTPGLKYKITMKIALGEIWTLPLVYKTSALTPELRRHVR